MFALYISALTAYASGSIPLSTDGFGRCIVRYTSPNDDPSQLYHTGFVHLGGSSAMAGGGVSESFHVIFEGSVSYYDHFFGLRDEQQLAQFAVGINTPFLMDNGPIALMRNATSPVELRTHVTDEEFLSSCDPQSLISVPIVRLSRTTMMRGIISVGSFAADPAIPAFHALTFSFSDRGVLGLPNEKFQNIVSWITSFGAVQQRSAEPNMFENCTSINMATLDITISIVSQRFDPIGTIIIPGEDYIIFDSEDPTICRLNIFPTATQGQYLIDPFMLQGLNVRISQQENTFQFCGSNI